MTKEAILSKLEAAFSERSQGKVKITEIKPLLGGACQDNYRIEFTASEGALKHLNRAVLRSDAPLGIPRSLRRKEEFTVIAAAHQEGVLTPRVYWFYEDLLQEGRDAYLMDWCDGLAIGNQVLRMPELVSARERLSAQCAEQLAKIHRITPKTHPKLLADCVPINAVENSLAWIEGWLDQLDAAHPAMEFALAWMKENPPTSQDITLTHGDFRTGNLMITPEGLAGVLDWEFSRWACPEEDLAWISVRDWRFGRLNKPIGGFSEREPFYQAYENTSQRDVSRSDIHFWEVFGNIRWAAGCVHQARRYLSKERNDLELISIGRRVAEMEYEALRLIEVGYAG